MAKKDVEKITKAVLQKKVGKNYKILKVQKDGGDSYAIDFSKVGDSRDFYRILAWNYSIAVRQIKGY